MTPPAAFPVTQEQYADVTGERPSCRARTTGARYGSLDEVASTPSGT